MRILLLGFGAVGQSFAELLDSEAKTLASDYGLRPRIVGIVDSRGAALDPDGVDVRAALASKRKSRTLEATDAKLYRAGMTGTEAIREVDCEVVVEATPTNLDSGEPGLSHVRAAMGRGRHVICTNKGPLAIAMPALMELARHNDVVFKFSGTVGGGTPVLDLAKRCLEGSRIVSVSGILNGTSNYVLTRMFSEGTSMDEALRDAQQLGYAEADPTYDIGGFDTACKLVILANYVMDAHLSIKDVSIKGITGVTRESVEKAKLNGRTIKLVGRMARTATVAPEEIPTTHPLNVSGTYNAVTFDTHPAGEITIVGKGAGGKETASSVIRDLIEIRRSFAR
ncbi:MAG: homoserine dehydrogenase [Thermoplasmata archaeon]